MDAQRVAVLRGWSVWGFDHGVGLYGFLGFCTQDGGYWYWGGDDWYYHYCS